MSLVNIKNQLIEHGPQGKQLLLTALAFLVCSILSYFAVVFLLAYNGSCLQTFFASVIGAAVAVVICGFWITKYPSGRKTLLLILLALFSRILFGAFLYTVVTDTNYFSGDGSFVSDNWEFYWTYDSAYKAADAIQFESKWNPHDILNNSESKNYIIHSWMGLFLAITGERHALDIASLNAFHHCVAGILLISIMLFLGYSTCSSFWGGVMLAWIPWGFNSMIMWRDSVGLCFVVLSSLFILLGIKQNIMGLLCLIPATYLAFAHREVYLLVVLIIAVLLFASEISDKVRRAHAKFLMVFLIVVIVVAVFSFSNIALNRHNDNFNDIISRFTVLPLLIIRAIVGPFPWSNVFPLFKSNVTIPDITFHAFQLAMLYTLFNNIKNINIYKNPLVIFFLAYWLVACFGGGVHTAYLAVASPFLISIVSEYRDQIPRNFIISVIIFVLSSGIYVLLGLHGEGVIMKTTGY